MNADWLQRARRRLLRPVLWLLGLNAALFVTYTLPRTLQELSLAEQQATLKGDIERERRNLARQRERAEAVRQNARDLEAFYRDVLLDVSERTGVLQQLDREAPSTGARSFRPEEVKGAPVTRFVVTMPLSGAYAQLLEYLRKLEASPYFVTIDRLSLREREPAAELDVSLSVYFRGAPPPVKG